MMFSKKDNENSQFTYRDYLEIQEKNWKLELQVQKKDEIIYELKKALSKRLYGVSDKELELVGPNPISKNHKKEVPDLDERVSPTKEIDRPASKKEPPKKYRRKVEIMQLCRPTAVTNEKWNEIVQHVKQFFADVIGNNEIEQIVATPVGNSGVLYLIIYKEEVKE